MNQFLENKIREGLRRLGLSGENIGYISLVKPPRSEMGEFSFACFELSKTLKISPQKLADDLVGVLNQIESDDKQKTKEKLIKKIVNVGPYVNFKLSNRYFIKIINKILSLENSWGKNEYLKNKIFIAEHTDPNLFKEFHIGHLMTNTIGESLSRLADFCGARVKQVTFQGDVGLHVAKTIYGILNMGVQMPDENISIWERQEFLGKCYAWGEKQYNSSDGARQEIININKKVYSWEDNKQNEIYEIGKKWSLEYFETIYEIVGSQFDYYFMESETVEDGLRLVNNNMGKIFKKSRGAIIFPGSQYGLHDRVFINSEGLPTYEAKDLGLFKKKWDRFSPDISLTITGGEQSEYFKVVKKAAGMINKEWEDKTVHLAHGMLRLETGKMSSRSGNIVRAKKWLDDTTEIVGKKMSEKNKFIAQKVALAAIKYSILRVQTGKDIVYKEEQALSIEGDTGPYLQYTYVRAKSVLRKAKDKYNTKIFENAINIEENWIVPKVVKLLNEFPESVLKSLQSYSPHYLANYLHRLASEFNSFYAHTKILDNNDPYYLHNLTLTKAVAQTIKNGLYLLGVDVVEKM